MTFDAEVRMRDFIQAMENGDMASIASEYLSDGVKYSDYALGFHDIRLQETTDKFQALLLHMNGLKATSHRTIAQGKATVWQGKLNYICAEDFTPRCQKKGDTIEELITTVVDWDDQGKFERLQVFRLPYQPQPLA